MLFVLGTAETFADSASSTLVPGLVARDDLGTANARMQGGFLLTNQLVAPPIGAFLFATGMAIPFATNAVCFVLGARARVARRHEPAGPRCARARASGHEMAEGLRWLLGHPPMRTLALTILAFNITFGAAWSVLVLYADRAPRAWDRWASGCSPPRWPSAGVVGMVLYGRLERRFSLGDIMRVGLIIETFTHLSLALTTSAGGRPGHARRVRRPRVRLGHDLDRRPAARRAGRAARPGLGGVYRVAIVGGLVIGTPLGGLLASAYGITAPFWFGFFGSAILVAVLWRQFDHIAHSTAD